jgi:outer membrane biosynthesis protein TonB
MLPPQTDRGRRLTLGAWTAALLLGAAAGAMAWRWNDVLQASQSLASAVRPPAGVQAPVPAAAAVVPPAEPATAQVAAPQPAATQVPVAPHEPAAPQVAMAPPAAASPAPQELPDELDRVPAPSAGPPAARDAEIAEPVPARPSQRQTARKTAKPPPSTQRTVPPPPAVAPAPATPTSPRSVCGARQNFSLYYCMQTQCRKAEFSGHAQCRQLRATDEVS